MRSLRLLITDKCPRACPGCCNLQWDLQKLPILEKPIFWMFDEVLITGGEPLLVPERVCDIIKDVWKNSRTTQVYVYTACLKDIRKALDVLYMSDGFTVTLHDQSDVEPFREFAAEASIYTRKSNRLNVFKGVDISGVDTTGWVVKPNMEWLENCPLPSNETFMRIAY